jgi:hypothetical protein
LEYTVNIVLLLVLVLLLVSAAAFSRMEKPVIW